jgi:Co/Zn/Cd efflux system component
MVSPVVDEIAIVDVLRQHGLIQHGCSPKKDKTHILIIILLLLCFYVARVRISITSNSRAVFLDDGNYGHG